MVKYVLGEGSDSSPAFLNRPGRSVCGAQWPLVRHIYGELLCDIVPLEHGFLPTLRIGKFEIQSWLHERRAADKMAALLKEKMG